MLLFRSRSKFSEDTKDGYELPAASIDEIFGEDSSNSNFYTHTTNSNSTSNGLANNNFDSASSAIGTNQGALKSINEANLLSIQDEQMATNQAVIDSQQNFELCQQIIANFDEELKQVLEKDQELISAEKLYELPIKPENSIHNILSEYEKFSLRMLADTSNKLADFGIQSKLSGPNDFPLNNQIISQTTHQTSSSHFISSNSSNSSGAASLGCPTSSKIHSKDKNAPLTISNSMPNSFSDQTIREFANSIEIYFNTLIPKNFLFYSESEKRQYHQLKMSNRAPVHLFGYVHLIRLIIILPDFLSFCSIPTKQLKQLVFILKHFCNYLVENKFKFMS